MSIIHKEKKKKNMKKRLENQQYRLIRHVTGSFTKENGPRTSPHVLHEGSVSAMWSSPCHRS